MPSQQSYLVIKCALMTLGVPWNGLDNKPDLKPRWVIMLKLPAPGVSSDACSAFYKIWKLSLNLSNHHHQPVLAVVQCSTKKRPFWGFLQWISLFAVLQQSRLAWQGPTLAPQQLQDKLLLMIAPSCHQLSSDICCSFSKYRILDHQGFCLLHFSPSRPLTALVFNTSVKASFSFNLCDLLALSSYFSRILAFSTPPCNFLSTNIALRDVLKSLNIPKEEMKR